MVKVLSALKIGPYHCQCQYMDNEHVQTIENPIDRELQLNGYTYIYIYTESVYTFAHIDTSTLSSSQLKDTLSCAEQTE